MQEPREKLSGWELKRLKNAVKAYTIYSSPVEHTDAEVQELYGISRATYYRYRKSFYFEIVSQTARMAYNNGDELNMKLLIEITEQIKADGALNEEEGE